MKKITTLLLIALCMSNLLQAQVKIGDNPQNIDASSILELESSSRVLVITRINTAEMNAIVPNQGALVYNTDTQCIHYYNGTTWANLCESSGSTGNFTTDAIVNNLETIVITPTADGQNVEVALNSITQENMSDDSIGTDQIQSRSIEDRHIKDNSIGANKLADASVGRVQLAENAVGIDAIDLDEVDLSSFANTPGFIISAEIVSIDAGNSIENRPNGAFFDQQPLLDEIDTNSTDIANHIATDNDISATNEIQQLSITNNIISLTDGGSIELPPGTVDTDEQNLTLNGNTINITDGTGVDLTPILGDANTDEQNLSLTGNIINITGGTGVDLSTILVDANTDNQQLTLETGNLLSLEGNTTPIDLTPFLDNQTITDFTFDDTSNALTLTIEDGNTVTADLSSLAGGGTQNAAEVPFTPAGNTTADDVQEAIEELQTEIDGISTGASPLFDPTTISGTGVLTDEFTVANNAITTEKILDGEVQTGDIADDAITTIKIVDDSVIIDKIGTDPTTDINKVLGTDAAGNPEWQDAITGIENAVFYAGPDGLPTTADDNDNPRDDRGFYWDPSARDVGSPDRNDLLFGALFVGLQGMDIQSNNAKMQIADNFPQGIGYALQVQNYSGSPTGILFSTATDNPINYGKGALVYENKSGNGLGDFHFLQNEAINTSIPVIADKAFSIRNNKDIVIYGGIEIDGGPGTGLGTAGQVLTSTVTGVQWSDPAEATVTGTAGSIFFADGSNGITQNNTELFWDDNDNRLNLGGGFVDREQKLNVRGGIRASEYVAAASTVQPSYRFDNDPDTGLKHTGANEVALVAGGEEMISLDFSVGNGNVIVANGSLELKEELIDINSSAGTAGQILSSTETGTAWINSSVVTMGKANGANSINTKGDVTIGGGGGTNTVNFNTAMPNDEYIIQLTVQGDNRIYVTSQTAGSFTVEIKRNSDDTLIVAEWYFTVLNF